MSILFRTKGWLTLAQLVRAWAAELPGAKTAPSQVERDLGHLLLEDIINGRLDESGPLVDGRRLGLRIITLEGRAGFLEGHRVHELTVDGANTSAADSFIWNRLVVLKEATLDFARRRELPPPSWWAPATSRSKEEMDSAPPKPTGSADLPHPALSARDRLLAVAGASGNLEPVAQRNAVKGLIGESLWWRTCTTIEILEAAYGDPQGWRYWELWLFEPLPVYQFADLLAVHRAAIEGAPVVSMLGMSVPVLDGYLCQIFDRLRAAVEAGEKWFIGDASTLLTEKWPSLLLRNSALTVRPREAIAWLYQNPNSRHLVPATPARMAGPFGDQLAPTGKHPETEGVTSEKRRRSLAWRQGRIERFTRTQRQQRAWINFAEISEWCAELGGAVVPNEAARASAYEKLQRDLLEGEFEENGRTRVLYLHPRTVKAKMTGSWMHDMIDTFPPATIRSEYLDHCWLPRNLFQRWLAKHHLPASPPRFEATPSARSRTSLSVLLPGGGQPSVREPSPAVSDVRKRGRRPNKLEQVKEAMRRDIRERRQTPDSLSAMLEKTLAGTYKVSRDTARKARAAVLSEFGENSNHDK